VAVPRRLDAAKQGRSDGRGDLVLDREYVLEFAVVTLRPKMRLGFAVDELDGHPYPIRSLAHASLDDVVDAEFAGDLLGLDRLFPCGQKRRCARSPIAAGNETIR
jgi:hypothetical protein